jgi:alpha-beta hydrolase superfamily lysophospholipase
MRRRLVVIVALFVAALGALAMGPRPAVDETIRFDAASVGSDVDAWLAGREAAVPDLKSGAQKEIVWADPAAKSRTHLAIVYLHGFSATKWETRPVPERIAAGMGANLFLTRLSGHGADGEALAAATMNDWVNDVAEAIAIGERLGDKVVIIGTSTGGTLAAWAAEQPQLMRNVLGMVLISPNFELRAASVGLLNMPWGETILPRVFGDRRSFEPVNELHGKWWTTSYPSRAVFPMAALQKTVNTQDESKIAVPVLVFYSRRDTVVDPGVTVRKFAQWAGPHELVEINNSEDPSNHVIAGDILSPGTTEAVVNQALAWVGSLSD